MSDQQTINISIFDKEYQVSCKPDEIQALRDSAYYLDSKMREIKASGSVLGLDRLAVMAALNIANEYLSSEQQKKALLSESNGRRHQSHDKLDAAITRLKSIV